MRKRRIAFVTDRLGFQEILTIPLLSAAAKAGGHAAELFEFSRNPKKACASIASFGPDILAYSICSNDADRYLRINAVLKKYLSVFSLFGGPHPTFFPDVIEAEGVDAICRGEADRCFPEFLDRFGTEAMYAVSNFSFKAGAGLGVDNPVGELVEDLDSLPFPDRELLYSKSRFMARNPIKVFMAGRGCPYDCSYCFNHLFNEMYRGKGRILRTKRVDYLIREIRLVRERYPLSFVKFHDDIFGGDRRWLAEFAEQYPRELGVPFLCYARPNMVSEEYCEQLKKAGCHSVSMAIECGNEKLRTTVLNRRVSDEQILTACKHLRGAGIRIYTLNMIGLPGETERDIFKTIELNRRAGSDYADASILQPYPGTRLTEYCKQTGYLDGECDRFESQYTETALKFDSGFKNKLFVLHKLFAVLVDHSRLKMLLRTLYRARFLNGLLNLAYRYYYGRHVHRRIFAGQIPLALRLRGAFGFFLSKSRV